jgi:hypothetical protein
MTHKGRHYDNIYYYYYTYSQEIIFFYNNYRFKYNKYNLILILFQFTTIIQNININIITVLLELFSFLP